MFQDTVMIAKLFVMVRYRKLKKIHIRTYSEKCKRKNIYMEHVPGVESDENCLYY